MSRLFGQTTPTLPRYNSASGSSRNRAAETSTQPCGSSAPSATCAKGSSTIFPPLTSGIDALPERFDAQPLYRVDKKLLGRGAQREIGLDDVLDHVGDLVVLHAGADQRAELGLFVGAAADGNLIDLLAVLLDAENADMADMVMAAGIDAAGDVDMQPADQLGGVVVGEATRQLLRNRDRAGVRQRAVVQSRAGDDVGHQVHVGRGEADLLQRLPKRRQIVLGDVRQRQVLLVADADFAE